MDPSKLLDGAMTFATALSGVDCKPRTVQHTIDDLVYTSTKVPASIGLELLPRVTALLGAGLTRAIATGDAADLDAGAVVRVADRAMRDGLVPLVRDLLQRMKCSRTPAYPNGGDVLADFDEHFAGEYLHLAKVCAFALAHNFRGPTYGGR